MSNKQIIQELKILLANFYALYLKTQNYHWNVEGPSFFSLHKMFEEQYEDLSEAIDKLAEIIRTYGEKAPASFSQYIEVNSFKNGDENANCNKMIKDLLEDNIQMESMLSITLKNAQKIGDEVVVGFIAERMSLHRKNAWMLKSSL